MGIGFAEGGANFFPEDLVFVLYRVVDNGILQVLDLFAPACFRR